MEDVSRFIEANWDRKSPLLLGYSGGPDSKALLYALIDCKAPIHIAHVDHGWRESSGKEALELKKEAESLHLPFHTIRSESYETRNLEAHGRDQRLAFFQSLFEKIPFQALLLAHQRDDLAETALKRIFEGAHLPFLGGMSPISRYKTTTIWRPLLATPREEILQFLEERKLSSIDDPTNRDPKFLRSRMRLEIFPFLNQAFGKNVSENLTLTAERAAELKDYLDRKVEKHPVLKAPWGLCFDLSSLERIEARHLLQKYVTLPRTKLEEILDAVSRGISKWRAMPHLYIDRGWVLVLNAIPK